MSNLTGFWRGPPPLSAKALGRKRKRQRRQKDSARSFFQSPEWLELRYQVLKNHNGCCQLCGQRATPENPLHVDHIKARSTHRHLQLHMSNLQVLCRACNIGKSNRDSTDWRLA